MYGFVNDFKKIGYGLEFKPKLKRTKIDEAVFRAIAGAGAVAKDGNIEVSNISWYVPGMHPSSVNRNFIQTDLGNEKS